VSVAVIEDVEAEKAYWDASATGDARWELFSVPGIEGWQAGVDTCLAQIVSILTPVFRSGATVLDLGCGIGRLTLPLADRFPDVTFVGVDLSPKMVSAARISAKTHGLSNARFMTGDGRSLPKSLPRLAGAFSMLTYQHLPAEAQEGYIRAIAAKLDPGGALRLQFVTSEVDHFLSHGVSPDAVRDWCVVAGLTVEAVETGAVDESWGWLTARKP
jgi:SAM-dependent methyltransferase